MDLKIKLKDEGLCAGCPMDVLQKACNAGFVREVARIDEEIQTGETMFGHRYRQQTMIIRPVRPQTCILANERAPKVIKALPTREDPEQEYYCEECHKMVSAEAHLCGLAHG